jgi:hypothetical protein
VAASHEVTPILLAIGAALAAGASGLGGLIRFGAWWKDRKLATCIESAAALAEKGFTDWQKALGQRLLARAHFARLTGIDVPDGHASLLALHERLGGSDMHLRQIRQAISLLDRHEACALPRAMTRRDWFASIGMAIFCLVFVCLALWLITMLAIAIDRVDWNQSVPVSKLMAFGLGSLYAGGSVLFSWSLSKEVNAYIAAHQLRQTIGKRPAECAAPPIS